MPAPILLWISGAGIGRPLLSLGKGGPKAGDCTNDLVGRSSYSKLPLPSPYMLTVTRTLCKRDSSRTKAGSAPRHAALTGTFTCSQLGRGRNNTAWGKHFLNHLATLRPSSDPPWNRKRGHLESMIKTWSWVLRGGWDERKGASLGKHWYRRWAFTHFSLSWTLTVCQALCWEGFFFKDLTVQWGE